MGFWPRMGVEPSAVVWGWLHVGGFESSPAVTHEPRSVPKPGPDKSCRHMQNGGHVCVTSRSMCNDRPPGGIKQFKQL